MKAPAVVGALVLLVAVPLAAQEAILEVRVPQLDRTEILRASHDAEGRLQLPRAPLEEMTGEDLGPGDHLTLPELKRRLGRGVEVRYEPARAALTISDPLGLLAAVRAERQARRNEARARTEATGPGGDGGPWAALVADERGEGRLEAGVQLGRVSVFGSHSTLGDRSSGGVSVRPFDRTWVSLRAGTRSDPRLALRSAPGPLFLSVQTDPTAPAQELRGRAALNLGRFSLFGTAEGSGAVGYRGADWSLLAGFDAVHERSVFRLGYGRSFPTLSLPRVR